MIEIKDRWTNAVIYKSETATTVKEAVAEAIKSEADLSVANLSGADLSEANLSKADLSVANLSKAYLSRADLSKADLSKAYLSEANLSKADLSGANLSEANLSKADLSGANLSKAYLSGADLSEANLSEANLSRANLSKADLSEAYLSRADLSRADLSGAKEDFFAVLNTCPNEVPGLRQALVDGRVDGSTYTGECACLVGTIANVRKCHHTELKELRPDTDRPAERWFLAIRRGHTPDNSQVSKITLSWIDEWIAGLTA